MRRAGPCSEGGARSPRHPRRWPAWVFVWMGGLWMLLSLCGLLAGQTTMALVSLGIAGLYAVALVVVERRRTASRA